MSNLYATYTAKAKHVVESYVQELDNKTIRVFVQHPYYGRGFYCDAPGLGMSRTYDVSTPGEAVSMFLREHGYYMIYPTQI